MGWMDERLAKSGFKAFGRLLCSRPKAKNWNLKIGGRNQIVEDIMSVYETRIGVDKLVIKCSVYATAPWLQP
jgi:hypothetical protein